MFDNDNLHAKDQLFFSLNISNFMQASKSVIYFIELEKIICK